MTDTAIQQSREWSKNIENWGDRCGRHTHSFAFASHICSLWSLPSNTNLIPGFRSLKHYAIEQAARLWRSSTSFIFFSTLRVLYSQFSCCYHGRVHIDLHMYVWNCIDESMLHLPILYFNDQPYIIHATVKSWTHFTGSENNTNINLLLHDV